MCTQNGNRGIFTGVQCRLEIKGVLGNFPKVFGHPLKESLTEEEMLILSLINGMDNLGAVEVLINQVATRHNHLKLLALGLDAADPRGFILLAGEIRRRTYPGGWDPGIFLEPARFTAHSEEISQKVHT